MPRSFAGESAHFRFRVCDWCPLVRPVEFRQFVRLAPAFSGHERFAIVVPHFYSGTTVSPWVASPQGAFLFSLGRRASARIARRQWRVGSQGDGPDRSDYECRWPKKAAHGESTERLQRQPEESPLRLDVGRALTDQAEQLVSTRDHV